MFIFYFITLNLIVTIASDSMFKVVFIKFLETISQLWILFTIAWCQVHHETGFLRHGHHRADALLLSMTEACCSSWQHASIRSNILRQNEHVGVFDVEAEGAFWAKSLTALLAFGVFFYK